MARLRYVTLGGLCCLILAATPCMAKKKIETLPSAVESGLSYLLDAVQQGNKNIDGEKVRELVAHTLHESNTLSPKKRRQGVGVFMRSTLNVPLDKILRYCYDPQIPPGVVFPNSIRRGRWLEGSDILSGIHLWEEADSLRSPVILTGTEFEEITPDTFSGSYYSYTLNRLLMLLRFGEKRVFISVSRQQDPSSVGKKGAIAGDDANWDYIYSNAEGATATGIGWADTYMYDSSAVAIFYDNGAGSTQTGYAVYKWLKAGWASLNMVRPKHIVSGTERFLQGFKRIIESDKLPTAEDLVAHRSMLDSLPVDRLVECMRTFSTKLEAFSHKDSILSRKDFMKMITGGQYASQLDKDAIVHALMKQYIKERLGVPVLEG